MVFPPLSKQQIAAGVPGLARIGNEVFMWAFPEVKLVCAYCGTVSTVIFCVLLVDF
jgi:hypothetical protein